MEDLKPMALDLQESLVSGSSSAGLLKGGSTSCLRALSSIFAISGFIGAPTVSRLARPGKDVGPEDAGNH